MGDRQSERGKQVVEEWYEARRERTKNSLETRWVMPCPSKLFSRGGLSFGSTVPCSDSKASTETDRYGQERECRAVAEGIRGGALPPPPASCSRRGNSLSSATSSSLRYSARACRSRHVLPASHVCSPEVQCTRYSSSPSVHQWPVISSTNRSGSLGTPKS